MTIKVKIVPNASANEIIGFMQDELKIKLSASPQKGKANKQLIAFLAKEWKLPKSAISITRGKTGRHKLLEIEGLNTIPRYT